MVKKSACNAGDPGLIPRSGRSPGEGNGNPLQYSCLENSMSAVYGITKSRTQLSDCTNTHTLPDSQTHITCRTDLLTFVQNHLFTGFQKSTCSLNLPNSLGTVTSAFQLKGIKAKMW